MSLLKKVLIGYLLLTTTLSGPGGLAAAQPAALANLYLPLITREFSPGYVSPFGAILYFDVGPNSGLSQMAAARSSWAVTRVFWSAVEPNAPVGGLHTYDWSSVDAQLGAIRAAGLQAFVTITGNPTWAAQYQAGPLYDAEAQAALAAFVGAAAARYPDVLYWSLYPEPDNKLEFYAASGWGWWGANPAGYASLLAQVKPQLAAANPAARLLNGPLAYDNFAVFAQDFLPNVLSALNANHGGAANILDGVAFHYYTSGYPTVTAKVAEIRGHLTQHNAAGLSLWIPEAGYPSGGTAPGETAQAQKLAKYYVRAVASGVTMLAWYHIFDVGSDTVGLFRGTDLDQPKPAYFTYRRLADDLYGTRYHGVFNAAGVEGYVFRFPDGRDRVIVWGAQAGLTTLTPFDQACLSVRRLADDALQTILDGGVGDMDASVDGRVTLAIGENDPLSVLRCP